ncbi:MAG: MFS transporter [Ilumatobacteraceae bacterium]
MRSPSTSPAGASVESSESDRPGASEGRAGTFVSLRVRNFRLYFVGQMISQTGTWLTTIAQTLLVLRLNGTGLVLGALGVAQFGPMLLLAAWAGAIADRAPKRKLLITIQSLSMAVAVTLGVVTLAGHATLGVVFAAALIRGTLNAFDAPCRQSFISEMVPNEHYSNAMSLNGATMTTARVIGPAIAGLLVTQVGFGWTFMADGLSFIAVLTGLALMRPHELTPVVPRTPTARSDPRSDPPHPQPTGAVGPDGAVDLHRRVGLQLRRQHPVARHRPPPRRRGRSRSCSLS